MTAVGVRTLLDAKWAIITGGSLSLFTAHNSAQLFSTRGKVDRFNTQ
jgi:hypothetical protein